MKDVTLIRGTMREVTFHFNDLVNKDQADRCGWWGNGRLYRTWLGYGLGWSGVMLEACFIKHEQPLEEATEEDGDEFPQFHAELLDLSAALYL